VLEAELAAIRDGLQLSASVQTPTDPSEGDELAFMRQDGERERGAGPARQVCGAARQVRVGNQPPRKIPVAPIKSPKLGGGEILWRER
jgi:hypothetical protein